MQRGLATASSLSEHAIYVVATSEAGTRRAFETAARRASAEHSRVVVVVPHPVPVGADGCGCDLAQLAEPYRALARARGCPTTVLVCVCRETCDVCRMIPANASMPSHVVVAGRHAWWRRSREEHLLRALAREGRAVEFIDLGATGTYGPISAIF